MNVATLERAGETIPGPRLCALADCNEPIPPERGSKALYCSRRCTSRASRRRELARKKASKPVVYLTCALAGCETRFEKKGNRRLYCSPECSKAADRAKLYAARAEVSAERERVCRECGEKFKPTSNQVYCEPQCARQANERKRLERIQAKRTEENETTTGNKRPRTPLTDTFLFLELLRPALAEIDNRDGRRLELVGYRAAVRLGIWPESATSALRKILAGQRADAIRHADAEAFLLAASAEQDAHRLTAFPVGLPSALTMADAWYFAKGQEAAQKEIHDLAHALARFSDGFLNAEERIAEVEREAIAA